MARMPAATEFLPRPLGFRIWKYAQVARMKAPHAHADIELNFLTHGALRYRHGGLDVKLGVGEVGLFWGGIPHQLIEAEPGLGGIWMTLPIAWLLRWRLPGNVTERLMAGAFIAAKGDAPRFIAWEDDFASNVPARLRVLQLELEAMFHRMGLSREGRAPRIRRRARVSGTSGLRIEQVTTYLALHYHETLSLARIGRAVGVHPQYLARAFRKHCGISVWEYLTRLRVAHAQRLLLTTDAKIIDVALESGFGSVAPFYAAFARYGGGRSPNHFRRGAT
jgi:AraC-like DNA-binding protein